MDIINNVIMLASIVNHPSVRGTCQNVIVPWCQNKVNDVCTKKMAEHTLNWYALIVALMFFVTMIGIITLLEQFKYINETTSGILFVIDIIVTITLYFLLN